MSARMVSLTQKGVHTDLLTARECETLFCCSALAISGCFLGVPLSISEFFTYFHLLRISGLRISDAL